MKHEEKESTNMFRSGCSLAIGGVCLILLFIFSSMSWDVIQLINRGELGITILTGLGVEGTPRSERIQELIDQGLEPERAEFLDFSARGWTSYRMNGQWTIESKDTDLEKTIHKRGEGIKERFDSGLESGYFSVDTENDEKVRREFYWNEYRSYLKNQEWEEVNPEESELYPKRIWNTSHYGNHASSVRRVILNPAVNVDIDGHTIHYEEEGLLEESNLLWGLNPVFDYLNEEENLTLEEVAPTQDIKVTLEAKFDSGFEYIYLVRYTLEQEEWLMEMEFFYYDRNEFEEIELPGDIEEPSIHIFAE